MNARDEGYALWKKGLKYQEIAEKCGVSLSTVKSWASRHWKQEDEKKDASSKKKKLQPNKKKLQPSGEKLQPVKGKKGAPKGNQNAKGNPGGGAPLRNKNNFRHGAYEKIYWDSLDETELELLDANPTDAEYQYEQQIAMYSIRERRLMKRIKEVQEIGDKSKGLFLKGITKEKTYEYTGRKTEKGDASGNPIADITETTTSETESIINTIVVLEEELTKVQRAKTKAIDSLTKLHIEKQKMTENTDGNDLVRAWAEKVRSMRGESHE